MRENLGINPVLERRDDVPAVRIVLGVRGEDEHDVHRDADVEPPDLYVLLLENIEEADLDARLEVRQLVDREYPPVAPRDDAEVDRAFVRVMEALRRGLDRIDVADKVGDCDVGRRELFTVPPGSVDPVDRGGVAVLGHEVRGELAHGCERVVVDLAPPDDGDVFVEKRRELPDNPRFGLAAEAEQDDVVPGEDRIDERGDHRLFVADDPGKEVLLRAHFPDQVGAELVLHRKDAVLARTQFAECRFFVHCDPQIWPSLTRLANVGAPGLTFKRPGSPLLRCNCA